MELEEPVRPSLLRRASAFVRRRRRAVIAAAVIAAVPFACDLAVGASATVHARATDVPHHRVALVLGTAPTVAGGRPNLYYRYRLEAAAELWRAGAVDGFLVSGDNGTTEYDEPTAMRENLAALGVPRRAITCDYAGFRTLDSVVRAKEVFGLDAVVVVSQAFHAERAVFLAQRHGLEAVGFAARTPSSRRTRAKNRAREVMARTLAVWDVIVGTEPRYLGPPVAVGTAESAEGAETAESDGAVGATERDAARVR